MYIALMVFLKGQEFGRNGNMWEMITLFCTTLSSNMFIRQVLLFVMLDTVLGLLRAIKERQFNSCFGIDGAIRKIAMVISVVFLAVVDRLIGFNIPMSFLPEAIQGFIGTAHIGICEFFCLLYIMYEAVSVLKNMCLFGLPVPPLQKCLEKWLKTMTGELDDKTSLKIGGDDNADRN